MGRKKSKSVQKPISKIIPQDFYQILTKLIEGELNVIVAPKKNGAEIAWNQLHEEVWHIIACWIAYKRYPVIDIGRYPYNSPSFGAWRRWAYSLNALLDLIQVTFDATRKYPKIFEQIKSYQTPINWWFKCMEEHRQAQPGKEPPPKENWLWQLKQEIKGLSKGTPIKEIPGFPHHQKLWDVVTLLRTKEPEIQEKVNAYIKAKEEFLTHDAPNLHALWFEEGSNGRLLTRTGKNPQSYLSPKELEKIQRGEVKLSIITHEAWKDQLVSVLDS